MESSAGMGGDRRGSPPPMVGDAVGERTMLAALIASGLRLAEALKAENEALAALDLPRAAGLAETKIKATEAFAAAHAAATRIDARARGETRSAMQGLASELQTLGTENRRLLERAVTIQSRVIETIAGAALPRAGGAPGGYGGVGRRPAPAARQVPALAVATRA